MLLHTDPFRDFDFLFSRPTMRAAGQGPLPMPMDAYRRGGAVWVHLDLPGVNADQVDIDVERNMLTVTAERGWEAAEDDQLYVTERRQGAYRRQVQLGDSLDTDKIEASLSDGVLTLRIPVAETAKPRKIEVTASSAPIEVETTSG